MFLSLKWIEIIVLYCVLFCCGHPTYRTQLNDVKLRDLNGGVGMCRMCHDLEQEMKQSSSVSTMMASFGWRVWKNCERKCAKSGASLAMLTRRRREVWRNES